MDQGSERPHIRLRKHEQAVPLLARYVAGNKRAKNRDYAMLLLAHSYEQVGQLERAAEARANADRAREFHAVAGAELAEYLARMKAVEAWRARRGREGTGRAGG